MYQALIFFFLEPALEPKKQRSKKKKNRKITPDLRLQVTKCSFMQPIQFFTIRLTVMPYGGTVMKMTHYERIVKAEFGPKR